MSAHRNYINGAWVESAAAPIVDRNPSDIDDVVGSYAAADAAQTRRAIEAARAAFPAWSRSSIQERADLLDAVGSRILSRAQEIGRLLAREEGKTLKEAVGETMRAGHVFKFHPTSNGHVLHCQPFRLFHTDTAIARAALKSWSGAASSWYPGGCSAPGCCGGPPDRTDFWQYWPRWHW